MEIVFRMISGYGTVVYTKEEGSVVQMNEKLEQNRCVDYVATDFFAGGKEKRRSMLAQPEACCDVCSACPCVCDVDCSCSCSAGCMVGCDWGCGTDDFGYLSNFQTSQDGGDSRTLGVVYGTSSLASQTAAATGSYGGGLTAGAGTYVYAQTVSYWWG